MRLILTPLKKELEYFLEGLNALEVPCERVETQKGAVHYLAPTINGFIAKAGLGKDSFAQRAEYWIKNFGPFNHLITVGSAGSLHDNLNNLDVVMAEEIIELQKITDDKLIHSYPCVTLPSESHVQKEYQVVLGKITSIDEDIRTSENRQVVLEKSKALAVAWEGAGGARVARSHKIPYSEIRGLTDQATGQVEQEFSKNLNQAIFNATEVLVNFFKTTSEPHQ